MSELSDEAQSVLADFISRGEEPDIEFGEVSTTELWCNVCLDHVKVQWPLKVITAEGVHDAGTVTACPRHEVRL